MLEKYKKLLDWYWTYQPDIAMGLVVGILLDSVVLGLILAGILAWQIKTQFKG